MIQVFNIEQFELWDKIVRSFKKYDVFWLSGYVKSFLIHGDGEPLLFYYESVHLRGINVVMKRDVANDRKFINKIEKEKYFDFATPYGYGGWIIEGNNVENLFEEYEEWIIKNDIISEFVRFHPVIKNHLESEKFYEVKPLGEVVCMDISSPDLIWNNISSKNRNVIRKSIKNGVRIFNGRFPGIYDKFRNIYNKTMERDNANEYYYFSKAFYQSILSDMEQNAQIFYAEKDEVIISASIILAANGMLNYYLSGSIKEYSNLAATNLLLYKVALWGNANGYKSFYLGGGVGSEEDGLFKFKRAFYKGELSRFYIGKKIYNQEKYDKLTNMRENNENEYFPQYRA